MQNWMDTLSDKALAGIQSVIEALLERSIPIEDIARELYPADIIGCTNTALVMIKAFRRQAIVGIIKSIRKNR